MSLNNSTQKYTDQSNSFQHNNFHQQIQYPIPTITNWTKKTIGGYNKTGKNVRMPEYYQLQEQIYRGTYSSIYKSNQFAIKIISLSGQPYQVKKYIDNQKQAFNNMSHQNIIRFYQSFELGDPQYSTCFVMQYCQKNLRTMIQNSIQQKLTQYTALQIFKQIVQGCRYLRNNRIVHRNLRPQNILFNDQDIVKIIDFSNSAILDLNYYDTYLMNQNVGGRYYKAPQILKSKSYTTQCQIWSLGVILYELIFGILPWRGSSDLQQLYQIQNKQLLFPSQVSQNMKNLITNMLKINVKQRLKWNQLIQRIQQMTKPSFGRLISFIKQTSSKIKDTIVKSIQKYQKSPQKQQRILIPRPPPKLPPKMPHHNINNRNINNNRRVSPPINKIRNNQNISKINIQNKQSNKKISISTKKIQPQKQLQVDSKQKQQNIKSYKQIRNISLQRHNQPNIQVKQPQKIIKSKQILKMQQNKQSIPSTNTMQLQQSIINKLRQSVFIGKFNKVKQHSEKQVQKQFKQQQRYKEKEKVPQNEGRRIKIFKQQKQKENRKQSLQCIKNQQIHDPILLQYQFQHKQKQNIKAYQQKLAKQNKQRQQQKLRRQIKQKQNINPIYNQQQQVYGQQKIVQPIRPYSVQNKKLQTPQAPQNRQTPLLKYIDNKPSGRLSQKQSLSFFRQILNGFRTILQNNYVHRDLKVQNILIKKVRTQNNQKIIIKIADFGMVQKLYDVKNSIMRSNVGTHIYMSPQLLNRQQYTSKSQIWSLGVILYTMLYGRQIYSTYPGYPNNLYRLIMNNPLTFDPLIQVSQTTKMLILRMLQIYQKDRISWDQLYQIFQGRGINNINSQFPYPNQSDQYENTPHQYPNWSYQNAPVTENMILGQKIIREQQLLKYKKSINQHIQPTANHIANRNQQVQFIQLGVLATPNQNKNTSLNNISISRGVSKQKINPSNMPVSNDYLPASIPRQTSISKLVTQPYWQPII